MKLRRMWGQWRRKKNNGTHSLCSLAKSITIVWRNALPNRVKMEARKITKNLTVKKPAMSPFSGRMRHGPILRNLAKPSPAANKENKKDNPLSMISRF